MNRLVMDYLVGKGYRDVAEAFWRDSATKRESISVTDRILTCQRL